MAITGFGWKKDSLRSWSCHFVSRLDAGNTRYVQSEDGLLVSRAGYPCEILS